ncbi:MAG: hypothetical protein PHF36_01635 [Candidatus Cloacimonetes bacterium]|nr:hypothetical protein [Candidatus Cloacimonadota bacterium]MDD3501227.1 hypothetical protein [Candidatus Cloacimonadota bacterium]
MEKSFRENSEEMKALQVVSLEKKRKESNTEVMISFREDRQEMDKALIDRL